MQFRVFADETRPLLQGARLTAFELMADGVDTTLICDNMVSQVMQNGWIQAVLVGCDRVAANGDACNKIGTSALPSWRATTAFRFMCWGRRPPWICAWQAARKSPLSSVRRKR